MRLPVVDSVRMLARVAVPVINGDECRRFVPFLLVCRFCSRKLFKRFADASVLQYASLRFGLPRLGGLAACKTLASTIWSSYDKSAPYYVRPAA